MPEPSSYRKDPPEESCTISTTIFKEFRSAGLSPDSEAFKERERLGREEFLKRQTKEEQEEESME